MTHFGVLVEGNATRKCDLVTALVADDVLGEAGLAVLFEVADCAANFSTRWTTC